MAKSNTIQFKGTFDGSQILNELKKVRASMSEAGASDTLFKNVDKDIVATEKLINDMTAQIQKGFSNTKEISAFEKQISKLQTNFLKISTGLKGANLSENFTFNSPEIRKAIQEIERLTAAQDKLKESSKNALITAGHNVNFNAEDVKQLQKAIDANEDLEKALIKVAKAKEQAARTSAGRAGLGTDEGKKYIADAKAGLTLEDLGATATTGKSARGSDDARSRTKSGDLRGTRDKRKLDEQKAIIAVNETYQQSLEETIKSGGNAADAVETMKQALLAYGVELSNVEQLQKNFANAIEGFYGGNIIGKGQRSALTKAQVAGKTNEQGEFELSEDAKTQFLNNEQVTAYYNLLQKIKVLENQLAQERENNADRANEKQEVHNSKIKEAEKNTSILAKTQEKLIEAEKEGIVTQEKMTKGFDKIKDGIKNFLSLGNAISGLRQIFNETFEDIKTLDKSFADIAMVTDYSVGEMWQSYDQYAEMANELGQTTNSVIQASGLFYQQGLDTNESLELTKDTMKLATLANLDFTEATSQMTSALRGFKMEMDEGARVTDVYSELAAKAAADVQGIAYAMSKTASIAESAGMEFETTSAFLTQMIETTQEAPENIGTAMKTIIARFTELKTNIAGTAESEFDDLDYNKVDTALKTVGVSIKDASGQFRDLDDVFLELSEKWDTLDRNSQRYIATIAAGSRQQSRFIAMMDNYERTIELVNVAQNSSGKSAEQFAKYQDTLTYKINKLKNSWEQLRVNIMDSDFFKNIVDIFGDLVGYLSDLDFTGVIAHLGAFFLGLKRISKITNRVQEGFSNLAKNNFLEDGDKDKVGGWQAFKEGLTGKTDKREPDEKMKDAFSQGGEESAETIKKAMKEGGKEVAEDISEAAVEEGKVLEEAGEKITDAAEEMGENIEEAGSTAAEKMQEAIEEGGEHAARNIAAANGNDFKSKNKKDFEIDDLLDQAAQAQNEGDNERAEQLLEEALQLEEGQKDNDSEEKINKNEDKKSSDDDNNKKSSDDDNNKKSSDDNDNSKKSSADDKKPSKKPDVDGNIKKVGKFGKLKNVGGAVMKALPGVLEVAEYAYLAGSFLGSKLESSTKEKAELEKRNYESALTVTQGNLTTAGTDIQKTETKSLLEAQETIEKLQGNAFLSTAQQEELTAAINLMNENYPELVSSYDENTGKIELLTEEIEKEIIAQQEQTELLLKQEAGAIAGQASSGYGRIADDWSDDKASTLNESSFYAKTSTNMGAVAGGAALVGGLGTAATAAAIGATIGSAVPVIGSIIGGVIGLGIGAIVGVSIEQQKQQTVNTKETLDKFRALDSDVQQKVFERLQDNGSNVANITQLETYIQDNTQKHQEVIDTCNEILQEIKMQETVDKSEEALEAYLSGKTYENVKGEEVEIDKNLVSQMVDEADASKSAEFQIEIADFRNEIASEDTSKARRQEIFSKFTNEATGKTLKDYYYGNENEMGVWDEYEALLNDSGKIKTLAEMTEREKEIAENLFGSLEKIPEGAELSKEFLTDIAINRYAGDLLELEGEEHYEKLQALTENENYEDWMEQYEKIKSGELSLEEKQAAMIKLQQEMLNEGIDQSIIESFYGRDKGKDGTAEGEIAKQFEETKKNLEYLKKEGWDTEILSDMSEQSVNEFYRLLSDLEQSGDEIAAKKIRNIYQKAVNSAWENTEVTQEAKQKAATLLASLTPDTFDSTKIREYEASLVELGYSSEEAADIITQLEKDLVNADFKPLITEIMGVEEGFKALAESAKNAKNEFSSFSETAQDIAANGLSADSLFSLGEMDLYWDSFNIQTGEIDYGNAGAAFVNNQQKNAEEIFANMQENPLEAEQELLNLYATKMTMVDAIKTDEEKTKQLIEDQEQAQKSLNDAIKARDEAKKAYDEARYGTDYYVSDIDPMANYTKELDKINKKLEEKNELLTESENLQDKINLLTEKNTLEHDASVNRQAQMKVYEDAILENQKWLSENANDFMSLQEDGTYIFNADALSSAKLPDAWKDEITRKMEETEEWNSRVEELSKEEADAIKRREQELRQYRDDYLSFLESGAEILKQQAEDEIKNLEEKYSAMEEADNNYLDALEEAINKQRELRERENSFNDLAQQEKKLALMQRDTSGANRKEIVGLEQDIEEERQNLLDQEIDNMIDGMKQLYESQTDLRNEEIELKNAIIEETNYTKQFADIASTWTSIEDANAFYLENTDTSNMLTEEIESAMDTFGDAYAQGSVYMVANHEEVVDFTQATADEVSTKIDELGTYLTSTTQTTTDGIEQEIRDTVDDTKEAWEEAKQSVIDYEDELAKAEEARKLWELQAEQGQAAMLETMTKNFQTESVELQKITIQTLQQLFTDEQIMKQLGLTQEQFDGILNMDILDIFNFSDEQWADLRQINQTKDSAGQTALAKNYEEKYGSNAYQDIARAGNNPNMDSEYAKNKKQNKNIMSQDSEKSFTYDYTRLDFGFTPEEASGYDITTRSDGAKVYQFEINSRAGVYGYLDSKEDADKLRANGYRVWEQIWDGKNKVWKIGEMNKFLKGGLVNYTGPAWVDGTPSKPEAFLSAQDTERIGNAAKLLADLPILNSTSNANNAVSSNIGDTSIEIHINVESLASDYDVDQMIERVKNDILDVSKPTGTSVILHK